MKLAIISVTNKGAVLADRLAEQLSVPVDIYAKSSRNPQRADKVFTSLGSLIDDIFNQYDGFIFIMAVGIVVRVIAAHIRDKRYDPAIVVMDEAGQHAISLLSGHIGGANDLTHLAAAATGARPVITTATDVANLPAADVLAVTLDLVIEPFAHLKAINAAIVNGEKVSFFIDKTLAKSDQYVQQAGMLGIVLQDMNQLSMLEQEASVVITDKLMAIDQPHIYLRPRTLAVGIGCRRGTTSGEILSALDDACQRVGRSMTSIAVIASTVLKQDELGLLAAIGQLQVSHQFLTNEQLEQCGIENSLGVSNFVKSTIGVGNVCEAAALYAGQTRSLLLPKTKYQNIAIAIAEVKYQ